MLKKGICVILHIAAVAVMCVTLLIGALRWGSLGARTDILLETGTYEYSGMCWLDAMNDAPMLWEYLDTQRFFHGFQGDSDYPGMGYVGDVFDENVDSYRIVQNEDQEVLYDSLSNSLDFYEQMYDPQYTNLRYVLYYNGAIVADSLKGQGQDDFLMIYEESDAVGYTLKILLDTKYPVRDYFKERADDYNDFQDLKQIVLIVSGSMFLVWLVTSVMLTLFSGKEKGSSAVALSWTDRPPLELVLLFWTITAVGVIAAVFYSATNSYYESSYFWIGVSCVAAALGDSLALTGYLSLVRRIKSHTLWKNSLCYRITNGIRRIVNNLLSITRVSQRLVVMCGTYFLLMLLCCFIHTGFSAVMALCLSVIGFLFVYRDAVSRKRILEGVEKITHGELDHQIPLDEINVFQLEVAEAINQVGNVTQQAVNQSMKDEHLKADLITNVSHDIKTPLTSIINYVDLLKREDIPNEKVRNYLGILDQKSQRLKQLTEDLVEASKLSSGNVVLDMQKMDFNEILIQALGEFEEKFASKGLQVVLKKPEGQVSVMGEGRRIWRILENLFQNIYKYAMPGTRVYAELVKDEKEMVFTLKNISQHSLNIEADELTERFIRGDVSRTTEGSGLGLSIARDLTVLQKGSFRICLDGDLFKVVLTFDLILENQEECTGL